jgi:hypothetical protein
MKKIDLSVAVEVAGATSVTVGLAMISIPLALVVLGVFLVWITEKVN